MRQWLGISLRRKLSLIMLVTTLVPLLLLGGFAFQSASKATEEKTKQAGIDTLLQMKSNLLYIVQDIENISIFLIGEREIQHFISSEGEDGAAKARLQGMISNLVSSKDYILDISIYMQEQQPVISSSTIYESELLSKVSLHEVKEKVWTDLYSLENYAGRQNAVSFIRPLRSTFNYQQHLGWIVITVNEQVVSRSWNSHQLGGGQAQLALMNAGGTILSSTEKAWLGRPLDQLFSEMSIGFAVDEAGAFTYGTGKDRKTVMYVREPGWTLMGILPYEQYRAQNQYILQLTAAAVVLSVVATSVIGLMFIRGVTKPLQALARLLAKLDPNEALPTYPVATGDEIGRLAESYNLLGKHIEKLKKQLIRGEARKKEADMRALQAQINPHFLYNTLSSIHWIALMNEEKRIADMVGSLSDFLRFSLNKGKEFCLIQQEIAHIENYVRVQSIRFPDKFDVDYSMGPELSNTYMLKLLLQPLVENAMLHGIQKKEGRGSITIFVEKKGSRIDFVVMDDGVGMTEEQLGTIRDQLKQADSSTDSSYGLRNVHERLQLHYGEGNGLRIESKLNAGTRVSFSIPMMEEPL
jgi:two-component system, sensor histidine kinase YesM